MKIVTQNGYTGTKVGTALALGYFDGLHIGHELVISQAEKFADAHNLDRGVFTFAIDNDQSFKGRQILSFGEKHSELERIGVEYCFEPPFSSFKHLSPEAFFKEKLMGDYVAKALFCGENFGFGAKRAGTTALLQSLCEQHGIYLEIVPMAYWQGLPVSSTRIREALRLGQIEEANTMLGRPYEVDFPVQHGKKLGSTLGFPTMNQMFPTGLQPPAYGVYITATEIEGTRMPSATGYGTRPTVDGVGATCETFIPGYSGDLYNKSVRVTFYKRIADVQKFDSKEALAQAVQDWAEQSIAFFNAERVANA